MREIPGREAGEREWLLFEQDGVLSRRQTSAFYSDAELRRRVTSGRWTRPHRGIYVTHNGQLTTLQRTWVGVLAAGAGRRVLVAGVSALEALDMRGIATGTVYVPISARLATPIRHRASSSTGSPCCRRATTSAACLPGRLRLGPSSTQRNGPTAAIGHGRSSRQRSGSLLSTGIRSQMCSNSCRGFGGDVSSWRPAATRRADPSPSPSLISSNCAHNGGLPLPTRQAVVVDSPGRRRYRDAFFEECRLHVEIDGSQHMDVAGRWADMQRQNDMWTSGDRVLRFPAWASRNDPQRVLVQIRAALIAAGWRPI